MLEALQASVVAGWVFVVLALCAIGIIALLLGGLWMYRDAQSRRMDATIWVVLLVLATLIGGIIGFAIVFIIYLVVRESHPIGGAIPYGYAPPMYPPSQGPPPTSPPGRPPTGPPTGSQMAPVPAACPVCGRPMMWVPQYGRWYCPTCGQYR